MFLIISEIYLFLFRTHVNIATGINWYLKYHAGIHLSWNSMHASLPNVLPPVFRKERHETNLALRYDCLLYTSPSPRD